MSLKVHQTDELHSPHIHSLKPFPSVVLVNHFPSPIPAKVRGIKWKRSSIWQQASGQNLLTRHFSAPEKPSQLVPSSPSASASDRGSTGLPLAPDLHWSYLPCLSRTKLSLFHNIRRRPSQMQSCIKGTSSDSASLYFSLRKPTICWSLTSFFRVNCLSFLHESEQFHHSFKTFFVERETELDGIGSKHFNVWIEPRSFNSALQYLVSRWHHPLLGIDTRNSISIVLITYISTELPTFYSIQTLSFYCHIIILNIAWLPKCYHLTEFVSPCQWQIWYDLKINELCPADALPKSKPVCSEFEEIQVG